MTATPPAVLERWGQALDDLEAAALSESVDAGDPAGPTAPIGLPGTLPPELEPRARQVLARIVEASARVTGQMTAVRTELGAGPARRHDASAAPTAVQLDITA